jgi:CRP-like cAMP-binding protein
VAENKEIAVASHGPGTFLGEVPLLLGIPYEVTIRTLTQSHLFRIKKETFWQMMSTCPSITQEILRTMAQTSPSGPNRITTTSKAYFTWKFGSWSCS